MSLQIDSTALTAALSHAASQLTHTKPLMQRLSVSLLSATEDNFAAQGRPSWAGLSPVTLARRRNGGGLVRTLEDTGNLAGSVSSWHSDTEAAVGSNSRYATTHQFGAEQGGFGRTAKNGPIPWGDIPARPFLPMTAAGELQPEAEQACMDTISNYLVRVLGAL